MEKAEKIVVFSLTSLTAETQVLQIARPTTASNLQFHVPHAGFCFTRSGELRGGGYQGTAFRRAAMLAQVPGHGGCPQSGAEQADSYRPRNPEQSLLYRTIAGNLETFLARQQQQGRDVPKFVEKC